MLVHRGGGCLRKKRVELDEVTLILRDLKCGDWIIRQEAVGRIGRLKDPSVLADLIHRLPGEEWYIREMVAAGIRSINNPDLSEPLKHGLNSGDDCTRNACARALGIMRCREAEDLLKKAVEDPDSRVRKTARTSLELIHECNR
jgi:HEAT repeat protein